MLILLPPSEGKSTPGRGRSLDLAQLSFPPLTDTRRRVLERLVSLCSTQPRQAMRTLGLGPTQSDAISVNASLPTASTAPAIAVYSGVLYDALDFSSLDAAARRRLNASVVISSALFGLLRPRDRIPAYRLSGGTTLPKLGSLAGIWREPVAAELAARHGVILDLRSGAYEALGPLPQSARSRSVVGRVLLERGGRRSIVSHHNKATKGRIIRELMTSGSAPRSVDALMADLRDLGFRLELHEGQRGTPVLDIIVRDL